MEENNINLDHAMDLANDCRNTVKVIGIGKTGCSVVDYLRIQHIKGVDFAVQIIEKDVVPNKIRPEQTIAEDAEQLLDLQRNPALDALLNEFTKVVLVIAGMGGTTERVVASKIAQLAKEREIITIGIVSIPFLSDGKSKYEKALSDISQLGKNVHSLLVIDTNKIKSLNYFTDFESGLIKINTAFTTIVKGVAAIVLHPKFDLKDLKTVLYNNRALVGFSIVSGKNRAKKAIFSALFLPLLKDTIISNATNVLLLVTSGTTVMTIDEIGEINDYIQEAAGYKASIIMSVSEDINLGESLAIAIIASGFDNLA
jgi:cell division protein FtsZ